MDVNRPGAPGSAPAVSALAMTASSINDNRSIYF
jgi:hypothetical protein